MRKLSISHDAVFISMEHWGGVWRRSQNLAAAYARRFPEQRILYVEAETDFTFALRTRQRQTIKSILNLHSVTGFGGYKNIGVTSPPKLLPNSLPLGKQINNLVARRHVQRAMHECRIKTPVFWINPYTGYHYAGRMGEAYALYDVGDDWKAITQSPRAMRWTRREDKILTQRADAVIVVSEYLRQQKQQTRDKIFLIPNGIDAERYADVWKRTLAAYSLAAQWKRPVLGYTGMLHTERLDIDLLRRVAEAFPDATIALVGSNFLNTGHCNQLQAFPNIIIAEPVPYREVPSLMAAFDVCLVPNLVNDFSESQNPLKLYEYLASGLPIVSTNVAGFRDYPDLVRIAGTPQKFIQGIREALAEGTEKATLRQAVVQSETWDARLDSLLEVIEYAKAQRNQ